MSEVGLGFLDQAFKQQNPSLGEQIAVHQQNARTKLGELTTRLSRRIRRGSTVTTTPEQMPGSDGPEDESNDVAPVDTELQKVDEPTERTAPVPMTAEQRTNFMAQNPFAVENIVGSHDENKESLRSRIEAKREKLAILPAMAASALTGVFLKEKDSGESESESATEQVNSSSFIERMNDRFDTAAVGVGSAITALHFKVGERINNFMRETQFAGESVEEHRERTEKRGENAMNAMVFIAAAGVIGGLAALRAYAGFDHGVDAGAGVLPEQPHYSGNASWMSEFGEYLDDKAAILAQDQSQQPSVENYTIIPGDHLQQVVDSSTGNGTGKSGGVSSYRWEFPDGTGGERLVTHNGMDKSVWYKHEEAFAKQFPHLTYRMFDGHIGLLDLNQRTDTSKLPLAAQRFWESRR